MGENAKNRHCVRSAETGLLTKFAIELRRTPSVVWDRQLGGRFVDQGDAPPPPPDSDTRRVLIKLSSSSIKLRCSQDFVERIGIASAAFFLFDVHNYSRADHWTD